MSHHHHHHHHHRHHHHHHPHSHDRRRSTFPSIDSLNDDPELKTFWIKLAQYLPENGEPRSIEIRHTPNCNAGYSPAVRRRHIDQLVERHFIVPLSNYALSQALYCRAIVPPPQQQQLPSKVIVIDGKIPPHHPWYHLRRSVDECRKNYILQALPRDGASISKEEFDDILRKDGFTDLSAMFGNCLELIHKRLILRRMHPTRGELLSLAPPSRPEKGATTKQQTPPPPSQPDHTSSASPPHNKSHNNNQINQFEATAQEFYRFLCQKMLPESGDAKSIIYWNKERNIEELHRVLRDHHVFCDMNLVKRLVNKLIQDELLVPVRSLQETRMKSLMCARVVSPPFKFHATMFVPLNQTSMTSCHPYYHLMKSEREAFEKFVDSIVGERNDVLLTEILNTISRLDVKVNDEMVFNSLMKKVDEGKLTSSGKGSSRTFSRVSQQQQQNQQDRRRQREAETTTTYQQPQQPIQSLYSQQHQQQPHQVMMMNNNTMNHQNIPNNHPQDLNANIGYTYSPHVGQQQQLQQQPIQQIQQMTGPFQQQQQQQPALPVTSSDFQLFEAIVSQVPLQQQYHQQRQLTSIFPGAAPILFPPPMLIINGVAHSRSNVDLLVRAPPPFRVL